ncbi:MAG UNVERIFIED_CONTAM: hypothetical protein LVR29_25685 [Microcystis novacekii LVE1205-3]
MRIALDNDGTVTDVHSSVRSLEQLSSRPVRSVSAPPPQGDIAPVLAPEPSNYEQLLAAEFSRQLASLSARRWRWNASRIYHCTQFHRDWLRY